MSERTSFVATVRDDLAATMPSDAIRSWRFWLQVVGKLLLNPRVRAVVAFRIGHQLSEWRLTPLALLLRARSLRNAGVEIHPYATVGPGLLLVHSSGVVIGPGVAIGNWCRIHQGATIGEPARSGATNWEAPTIGDHVMIGAHAVILGAVTIGDHAVIAANAVVTQDVSAHAVVGGVPARELRKISPHRDFEPVVASLPAE
ncbi:MAG: serine acetyltransferase [Pseudonocardiales bacterium]|nr:MAG: serine acetyltransferase [Pseudonocardiales bacterium]